MTESWTDIVARLRQNGDIGDDAFQKAMAGIIDLAASIADGPLRAVLYGWTSMHDLCIQQTDVKPYAGPYLRIEPLASGEIGFRYVDTAVADHQWQRIAPVEAAQDRFMSFLDQLSWTARTL